MDGKTEWDVSRNRLQTEIECLHMFGYLPSNELFLTTDVLVVIRVLHNFRNVHNKVHKGLCLLAKEVQEVAKAAVLCDHKHWS